MGGAGTLFLGSTHAKEWAAIAPIAPAAFLMNDNRATILQGIRDGGVPDSRCFSTSVPRIVPGIARFPPEIGTCGGLRNRCR
jgi:hypothetical protein